MYYKSDRTREVATANKESYRSEFRRDSARILHCPAFRRLQGKMQLFPGQELDFFRNRLTHSLEVGQIGRSIAVRLNATETFLEKKTRKIDPDLVELAGWSHDLGHPPFGHTGEEALDECMRSSGGFEGNAQTLRILARLEKRVHTAGDDSETGFAENGRDCRAGLNLTYRSLAAVLKYDEEIPPSRNKGQGFKKGYYREERQLAAAIKKAVLGDIDPPSKFKTIECSIMDLADDIAYSTYDLEDAFKGGFLSPFDLLAAKPEVVEAVAVQVSKSLDISFEPEQVREVLSQSFERMFIEAAELDLSYRDAVEWMSTTSRNLAQNGYHRTGFTSSLISQALQAVEFEANEEFPALSGVRLGEEAAIRVSVLKHFTFQSLILSPDLRVIAYRGRELVKNLWKILTDSRNKGEELLPRDIRQQYEAADSSTLRKRIVCDFIAGMTDSYAVEYYGRLTSETPQTMFKRLS